MQTKRSDPTLAQRAVVLQALRDDHPGQWTQAALQHEVFDIDPDAISGALIVLTDQGVMVREAQRFRASRCARHLDGLGLISV
jgi:hypothetical protein